MSSWLLWENTHIYAKKKGGKRMSHGGSDCSSQSGINHFSVEEWINE